MSDNINVKDGGGASKTLRTTDNGGIHTPHQIFSNIENASGAGVSVPGTGLTVIADITNTNKRLLCFQFDVVSQNLDDVNVYGRAHASAQLVDLTPVWLAIPSGDRVLKAARSTTSSGALVDANLDAVTSAQNGYFEMDISGLVEIIVKASAAADSASVTSRWSLQ